MLKLISSATSDLVVDQRVHRSCKTLLEMGFEVISVGRVKPDSKKLTERPYETKRINCFFHSGPVFYAEYNFRLFIKLFFLKPDILLSNDLDTLPANALLSFIKGIPLVYDSHEYFTEVPELMNRSIIKNTWRTIEKLLINKPVKHITVCDSISIVYAEKFKLAFSVVRNIPEKPDNTKISELIDLKEMASGRSILIYQGAINKDRGLEEMIGAMRLLEHFFLVIIGKGDVYNDLTSMVDEFGLNDRIVFLGEISFEQLPALTRQADLALSLEKQNSLSYQYALPNKVFDYIQSGVPVLMSNLIELKRLNDQFQFGVFIEEITPEVIAQKVQLFFNDSELYTLYRSNAKAAAKELNWSNEKVKLEAVFKDFLFPF